MNGGRAARVRERIAVGVAVGTVLLLVGLRLCHNAKAGRAGETARARDIERLIRSGQWDRGMAKTQAFLGRHPLERRARLYMSQCQLARDVPHAALQHLALAATPLPPDSQPQFLPLPSEQEIGAVLGQLGESFPGAMGQGTARLRQARLAAMRSDWLSFEREVRGAAGAVGRVPGRSFGTVSNAFLASALMAPPHRIDAAGLPSETIDALVGLACAGHATIRLGVEAEPGALPFVATIAGGSFTGGEYRLWVGPKELRYPSVGGWCFVAVDTTTGEPFAELRHDLAPLSNEVAVIQSWQAALPDDVLIVGMASGEAVMNTSQEGRGTMRRLWGLSEIPGSMSLTSVAFVVRSRPSVPPQVASTTAAAPDLPALLYVGGGGGE